MCQVSYQKRDNSHEHTNHRIAEPLQEVLRQSQMQTCSCRERVVSRTRLHYAQTRSNSRRIPSKYRQFYDALKASEKIGRLCRIRKMESWEGAANCRR